MLKQQKEQSFAKNKIYIIYNIKFEKERPATFPFLIWFKLSAESVTLQSPWHDWPHHNRLPYIYSQFSQA